MASAAPPSPSTTAAGPAPVPGAPDLFAYDDYHVWLGAWFAHRKQADPQYSFRRFAAACGQASGTILEALVAGRRNLTPARVQEFLPELALPPTANARLGLMVRHERAETQLQAAPPGEDPASEARRVTLRAARDRIALELRGLDRIEAYRRAAVAPPRDIPGLLKRLSAGEIVLVNARSGELPPPAARALLVALHQAGSQTLARVEADPHGEDARLGRILGLTQALAEKHLPRVEEEVDAFVRHLVARWGDTPAGRPFALTIGSFPLTVRLGGEARSAETEAPAPEDAPVVYDYDDYPAFVARWFEYRREEARASGERFSLQTFAEEAGLADRTLPNKVIARKQGLTEPTARAFARGMGMDADDEEFFVLLVQHGGADEAEAPALAEAIRAARVLARSRTMRSRTLKLFTDWYHFAIHEMGWCPGMPPDPQGIAQALQPQILTEQASDAVRTLVELGMLERAADGRLLAQDAALVALKDLHSDALHPALFGYHLKMHLRSAPWLAAACGAGPGPEPMRPGPTSFAAVALRVPEEEIGQLDSAVRTFSQKLLGFCGALLSEADRVYQVNIHLLPIRPAGTTT